VGCKRSWKALRPAAAARPKSKTGLRRPLHERSYFLGGRLGQAGEAGGV
jgi:hypothetical protein